MRSTKYVFIVGVGRSGTTLLQSMLNAHSQVCFPPETSFLRRYAASGLLTRMFAQAGPEGVLSGLIQDPRVQRLKLDPEVMRDLVSDSDPKDCGVALYQALLQSYAAGRGQFQWLGDKDPRSIELIPLLHHHMPQATLIHIYRDPRDVLASKMKAQWSMTRPALFHIFANRVQLAMGRRLGRSLFGDRYVEVCYETLLAQPERELARLCQHLNLEFEAAMLDFGDSSKDLVSRDEMQWKKEALGPLLPKNTGKWKKALSSLNIALTERLCSEAMTLGPYEKAQRRSMGFQCSKLLAWVLTPLVAAAAWAYRYRKARKVH